MKPWHWAVGTSLVLHLGAFAGLASVPLPPSPPKGERVGERGGERGGQIVSFTRVTLAGPVLEKRAGPRAAPRPPVLPERSRGAPSASDPMGDEESSTPLGQNGGGGDELASASASASASGSGSGSGSGSASALSPTLSPLGGEGDGVDVSALVHARLAAMADRCYPAAARRFQQRGTVQLAFCTDARGGAASTSVTQSSGAALLDAAARGCVVENAAPFPPEAASRCFSVPVRFGARPAQ